jgi:hypothetical protein
LVSDPELGDRDAAILYDEQVPGVAMQERQVLGVGIETSE